MTVGRPTIDGLAVQAVIPRNTFALLEHRAAITGRTRSAIIRDALAVYLMPPREPQTTRSARPPV